MTGAFPAGPLLALLAFFAGVFLAGAGGSTAASSAFRFLADPERGGKSNQKKVKMVGGGGGRAG